MSQQTPGEGATVEIVRVRDFTQARLLPGTYTDDGVAEAAVYLIRPDNRTITAKDMQLRSGPGGHLDAPTAQFVAWLSQLHIIKYISADCGAGMMSVVLFLNNGHANPGLILLNELRGCGGESILNGTEVATLAGITGLALYPGEISPAAARLTYKMDRLFLEAANQVLRLPPPPTP